MDKKKLLIIGAGGHAKAVIDAVDKSTYEIVGLLEKDDSRVGKFVNNIKIIGTDSEAEKFYNQGILHAVIGIGHLGESQFRGTLSDVLERIGYSMINVIHKTAVISEDVILGVGNVILANTTINAGARLGNNNIINTGSIIEHEVTIGNNVHTAPGSIICGTCKINDNTFIGAGSIIVQGMEIGKNVLVGAGSTVINSIQDGSLVYGSPARFVRRR